MTTKTMTAAQKRAVIEAFGKDDVTFHKDGTATVKQGYFYRVGKSVELLKASVTRTLPTAEVVDCGDRFRPWPKDSYLWVRFRLADPK